MSDHDGPDVDDTLASTGADDGDAGPEVADGHHGRSDPLTRRVNPLISTRPWTIVLVFLVLTVVFFAGIGGGGEQQAGTDQFVEELDEYQANEEMQDRFERGTLQTGGSGASLMLPTDGNVLSKPSLVRMLTAQERLENDEQLRITSTTSPATFVAQQLDPEAETPEEQRRAVERASERQILGAIRDADESGSIGPVSTDFSAAAGSASVAQIGLTYDTPPNADESDRLALQKQTIRAIDNIDGYEAGENAYIFSGDIISDEIGSLLNDTAIIVFPAVILLIVVFLALAYRDPVDLVLGFFSLLMTLVWTFGFMGYAGIPFSDSLITIFPLLFAVGVDFGIHIINRYREEKENGADIEESMLLTTNQLSTAFLIVTLTTVFSFMANLVSQLSQLRDFGIVASFGMIFTFAIFGIFLPAGKVGLDNLRQGTRFPNFGSKPLGRKDSALGRALSVGTKMAKVAPALVLVTALVIGAGGGAYGTGVDTEFSQEAFFPSEDRVALYQNVLPEPFAPSDYTFITIFNIFDEEFDGGFVSSVTVFIDDNDVRSDEALQDIDRALEDPPPAIQEEDRRAQATSILGVIEQRAEADPEFEGTVSRYDATGDGVPDRNVDEVYEELLDSPARDQALNSITSDRSATRIQFEVEGDADQEEATAAATQIAEGMALDATPTGQFVINQVVIDLITESAIEGLLLAFLLTAVFLLLSYWWLEGRAIYGVINLIPVLVVVGILAGSMRYFDVPLTPFNAPILAVSIGLGVDYNVHFMHRFVDEFEQSHDVYNALEITARGTGGALTGSMLTTVCGLGVLYLALIPLIAEYGLLIALSVGYAYLASILVLPSTIVVWHRLELRYGRAIRGHTTALWTRLRAVSGS